YDKETYTRGNCKDPKGPATGSSRVMRGVLGIACELDLGSEGPHILALWVGDIGESKGVAWRGLLQPGERRRFLGRVGGGQRDRGLPQLPLGPDRASLPALAGSVWGHMPPRRTSTSPGTSRLPPPKRRLHLFRSA